MEKAEGWRVGERRQKTEDRRQEAEDRRQKTEDRRGLEKERVQGFEDSRGRVEKAEGWRVRDRRQETGEGWRVRRLAKAKGSRSQGFKGSSGSLGIFF